MLEETTPLQLRKAIKNTAELAGMQEAHLRDGAAMAAFFAWLEGEVQARRPLTEVDIDTKLIELVSCVSGDETSQLLGCFYVGGGPPR